MQDGYFATVTITSGPVGEKIKYYVPGKKAPRSIREREADLRKQLDNQQERIRHLARLLNANYPRTHGCSLMLSYSDEGLRTIGIEHYDPQDPEQWDRVMLAADKAISLWIRRARNACRKAGIELRCIYFTSDLEWNRQAETYLHTRIHHHLIVNPEAAEICCAAWHAGNTGIRRLRAEADHSDLAEYLVKQCRRPRKNWETYHPTRNLRKPKRSAPRIVPSGREVQPPRGASLVYRSQFEPGRPQYIRYILPPDASENGDGVIC